jgi:hypothetical protein
MTKGQLIVTGIAVGTIAALFAIPKTRKLITDAVSNLSDSLKNMAANELQETGKKLASS